MSAPNDPLSPQFELGPRPRVASPQTIWPLLLGLVAAIGLGGVVFWQLSSNRLQLEEASLVAEPPPVPAPTPVTTAELPPPIAAAPPPVSLFEPEPVAAAFLPPTDEPDPAVEARLRAPSLIIDLGEFKPLPDEASPTGGDVDPAEMAARLGRAAPPGLGGLSAAGGADTRTSDERFAERLGLGGSSGPAKAQRSLDLSNTIVEGSLIPAVLETALNSDLPGYVRAVVSRDVRGFDGSLVLIPRGSRLIGQYRSGVALGQSRAFVIWTRLIRPDGVDVPLAAPGADELGRGGLEGEVDRHFLRRFGGAILLSLLTIGVESASSSSDTAIIIASTRAGGDVASVALSKEIDIPPTVTVMQGTPVRVFVSQDLDFSDVGETN